MKFSEVVAQTLAWLQREGRVSYRALRLEFDLTEDVLDALKEELIEVKELAVDKDGKMLVWKGAEGTTSLPSSAPSPSQPPASYTPPHLAERIRAEQKALEARGSTDGERKTITALFADLKGSTALIEGLDPEEARAIIDPALQLMMDAVHRYEGYVAQALGDGIFALFGAPIAHEDHPQRALFAALHMQEEMRRYADTLRFKGYPPLLMRVGVNTGEVVLRSIRKDDLHADYVPVGHSTNLAARMEQLAAPGSILVTVHTHKLTDGYFAFKDLGQTQIKGVEAPLSIYEVLGAGPLRTRLQVSVRRGLTRFVGRQREIEQLQTTLAQAKAGHGQIVGVMGEPGIGKSRLFHEFVGAYCNTPLHSQATCLVLQAYSVSYGKASPYLPVIELLKGYFRIEPRDDERTRREKVAGKVVMLDRSLEDTLPYLFALLGIEEQPSPLQQMDPQIRRRRTFDALKKLFLRESLNQPLILIFEDLHWIDTETQGFLDTLSESVASAKILLLVNYRPEYRHEWGQKTYYTQLRLVPFGKAEAEEFLIALLGEHRSPLPFRERDRVRVDTDGLHQLKQLILAKTEGTPFFMEEVVQTLAEEGVLSGERGQYRLERVPTELHISPTVQGVLAARIDRLAADEKALLQQLAVIGRQFPLSLLRQVIPHPEEDLYRLLASLQRKEFLYEQPAFPEVEYIFKHALTQEVAYGTVLQERRKALHERTAQALETLYAATLPEHYSDLAHHYTLSGNTQKAVGYLQLAGQQAVQRSANTEAITHLTSALKLLKTLPDSPERAQRELTLQLTLGAQLIITKGYSSPEVEGVYSRAHELCGQVGETSQRFAALLGLWTFAVVSADFRTGREVANQLMSLAQTTGDPVFIVEAHEALGWPLFWSGEIVVAHEQVERGVRLYDAKQHGTQAFRYWQDPGLACCSIDALALWELGYPDQALQKSEAALAIVQDLSHAYSLAAGYGWAALHSQLRREENGARQQSERAMALALEHGFPHVLALATILRGWALVRLGQVEGLREIHQGVAGWLASGAKAVLTWFNAMLAEAQGQIGQPKDGLATLEEAFVHVTKSGERFLEAELYRLKGELTLQEARGLRVETGSLSSQASSLQPQVSKVVAQEAEGYFHKAIEVAQKQQAKSLELRAVMSLSRLWQQQDKRPEAHQMLSEIYGWFTEGFDTKDLQEAKSLLEELR